MDSYLLVEEGEADPHPSLRRKGNLYLLAQGSQAARFLRAVRDQYCGDPLIGGTLDLSAGVFDSLEAASALLAPREAGVSCMAVITKTPNRLTLVGAGDCRAFFMDRSHGSPQSLLVPRYPHKKLAMEASPAIEKAQRALSPGDTVVLCCGPLSRSLGLNELLSLLASQTWASPQALADYLATEAEESGGGAVLVIACDEARPDPGETGMFLAPRGDEFGTKAAGVVTPQRRRKGKLPIFWLLAVFVAVMVGSATLETVGKEGSAPPVPPSSGSSGAQPISGQDMWAVLDQLWARGQRGDVDAWQQAVFILEKLKLIQPGDASVAEKLRAAQLNLQYAQAMLEVAQYWGTGETSAKTLESWDRAIQVLEDLQAKMGGTGFLKPVIDKLYAARVNYGKALEAAGKLSEARATYEKARALDQSRPEALDALSRIR